MSEMDQANSEIGVPGALTLPRVLSQMVASRLATGPE
jgi:hypothetical protein